MLLAGSSCTTISGSTRRSEAEDLKVDVFHLKSQVASLEESNRHLNSQMEALRQETAQERIAMKESFSEMRRSLDELSSSRNEMKSAIVADLSGKMAKVINEQVKATSAGEVGRYHTVAKGETLSAISTAYGVKVDSVVKANSLKDANSIRVGQKLFIPE